MYILEKEMATHSSILAWKIPPSEEPGGLQSVGLLRVRHDLASKQPPHTYTYLLFSRWIVSDSLRPHRLQHARLPCSSLSPRVCSNSRPLSWWCHPTILSSVISSSCLQSFPASGVFPVGQLFSSGSRSIEALASASVLPVNIQDWIPLGLTSLISLQSKGLSRCL